MNASSRGKGLFILFFSIKSVQKIEKGVNDYNRVQVQDIHASQYIFLAQNVFFVQNKLKFSSLYEKYRENNLIGYKIGNAMIYTHNIAFIVN